MITTLITILKNVLIFAKDIAERTDHLFTITECNQATTTRLDPQLQEDPQNERHLAAIKTSISIPKAVLGLLSPIVQILSPTLQLSIHFSASFTATHYVKI